VDADKQTIAITMGERREAVSLKVDPDARLVLNGRAGKLADFTVGTRVTVMLSLDKSTVLAITSLGRGGEDRPAVPRREAEAEASRLPGGILFSVDVTKGTIEVVSGGEDNPILQTYALAENARAYIAMERVNSSEIKIASLPKATRVRLKMTEDKKVSAIEVVPPMLRVQIKSVDAGKNTLTYASEREEKTLEVSKDVAIQGSRRDGAKLEDITPNSRVVLMLTPDRNRVVGILIVPQDREREER
jgi:hypothetical protein